MAAALAALLAAPAARGQSFTWLDPPQPGSGVADLSLGDGTIQRVLYRQPEQPVAALVLLGGGDGRVTIDGGGRLVQGGGSFLVRLRDTLLARGFAIAVLHASDPLWGVRSTPRYAEMLRQVVEHVRSRTAVPIWLAGQSAGAVAATNGAAHLTGGEIAGLLLSSAITLKRPGSESVFSAGLERVTVATLVVAHVDDRCIGSPASEVDAVRRGLVTARTVEVMMIDGGPPPRADACQGESPHGFFGVEDRVIEQIARRIPALQGGGS